ncbi:MAG: hypothetical protein HYX92_19685 [Chloroflexi bacterium]|nr:hypothetical protein [Chloroflexota bacterium]
MRTVAYPQKQAKDTYYAMMGWENAAGRPSKRRLEELWIGWVDDKLSQ